MIDMGHNAKLTSGMWLVLPWYTTFAFEMGHKISWNFFYINLIENKPHHCCDMVENHTVVELCTWRCFWKHTKLCWFTDCKWELS